MSVVLLEDPDPLKQHVSSYGVCPLFPFRATQTEKNKDWVLSNTNYGVPFVSTVNKGQVRLLPRGDSCGTVHLH